MVLEQTIETCLIGCISYRRVDSRQNDPRPTRSSQSDGRWKSAKTSSNKSMSHSSTSQGSSVWSSHSKLTWKALYSWTARPWVKQGCLYPVCNCLQSQQRRDICDGPRRRTSYSDPIKFQRLNHHRCWVQQVDGQTVLHPRQTDEVRVRTASCHLTAICGQQSLHIQHIAAAANLGPSTLEWKRTFNMLSLRHILWISWSGRVQNTEVLSHATILSFFSMLQQHRF